METQSSTLKLCRRCEVLKPTTTFAKSKNIKDGFWTYCKPCDYIRNKEYIAANREKHKEKRRIRMKNWQQLPLEKLKARSRGAVARALKKGEILKEPCEVCGETKSYAHHDDYSKPLDIRWVCAPHHKEIHNLLKA